MNKQTFIDEHLALANELIKAKRAFDSGSLSELGFRLVLIGAKEKALSYTQGFAVSENGDETDELIELDECDRETYADYLNDFVKIDMEDVRLGGSSSFLIAFVGEYIYYEYILRNL